MLVGQFEESSKIMIRNVAVGDMEMKKINQQHLQGLLESQKMPPRHPQ